jgi:hypothetical protein
MPGMACVLEMHRCENNNKIERLFMLIGTVVFTYGFNTGYIGITKKTSFIYFIESKSSYINVMEIFPYEMQHDVRFYPKPLVVYHEQFLLLK